MHIGAKIKLLRKEKRVTQEELAEYLHISAQAVSKWETGASSPDIDMLPKLAIFFGTSLDHLLDFDQSQVDAAVTALVAECGKQTGGDPEKGEAFLRKALEKYPNNDLLLTCLLEFLQEQNQDGARCAEIVEIGERVLTCTRDDELKIDVLRILAETYHSMGEQAMAEYYLTKIPALHFFFYEIAAAIKAGPERLENVQKAEDLCIDKLICMLAMRKEEVKTDEAKAQIDRQAREMLSFFKSYPIYRTMAELMERGWQDGTLMEIYR